MRAKTAKVGRPRIDSEEVRARMPRELLDMIDAWRAVQADKPARAEAVRRLLTNHFWPNG
jgi:hypothetical protein